MNLPLRGNAEMESHVGNDFLHLEGTCLFHLELFGSVHVEISSFKPVLFFYLPESKFTGYLFFHLLLGYLVGSLGIILSGR